MKPLPDRGVLWVLALSALIIGLFCSCARFTTHQTDESLTNPDGTESRIITTRATSYTLWSAKSALANLKVTQTDKTQGASVGNLNQEASDTNIVNALGIGIGAALKVYLK